MKKDYWGIFYSVLLGLLVCTATIVAYLLLYVFDNKYRVLGPQGNQGTITLNEKLLKEYPLLYLIDGWGYYADSLLTPEDFLKNDAPQVTDYISIGGNSNREKQRKGNYGSASYQLILELPNKKNTYLLEIPEVFSSYRLYINRKLITQMGNISEDNYQPQTGRRTISIDASGRIEILLATSNYSSPVGGLVAPPVFGYAEDVASMFNVRLFLQVTLCIITVINCVFAIFFGFLSKRKLLFFLYGGFCFLLVVYMVSPLYVLDFQLQQLVRNISFCGLLLVVMLIMRNLSRTKKYLGLLPICFGALMCLFSLFLPFFSMSKNLEIMSWYPLLMSVYQWVVALYIMIVAFKFLLSNMPKRKFLFYVFLIFGMALIIKGLQPLYIPIRGSSFIELASFLLIVCISLNIGRDIALHYKGSNLLVEKNHSMRKLYEAQQGYYTVLYDEIQEVKKLHHDMHHHLIVVSGFIENSQYNKLSAYIAGAQIPLSLSKEYCAIDVINILSYHFEVIAKRQGIIFEVRCDLKDATNADLRISEGDLCCIYANLVENAVESCLRIAGERLIQIALVRPEERYLAIYVWNSGDKNSTLHNGQSSKKKGRMGYGLLSVKSIIEKYEGTYEFSWDEEKKLFKSEVSFKAFK